MGGARLVWGFSWNTSNGASITYKNTRKIAVSHQTRHCSIHIRTKLTIPFRSPHLIRSRTRPCVSQRAEKFTTAHRSSFVGCTNFYTKSWKYCENHWIKIIICRKLMMITYTLLLKFHRPFLGKKSSPLPTFNCWENRRIRENLTIQEKRWLLKSIQMLHNQEHTTLWREIPLELAEHGLQLEWSWY